MKALLLTIAAAGSMLVAAQANAVDAKAAEALAQKSGCLACHSVEKKVIGPAYKDVAAEICQLDSSQSHHVELIKSVALDLVGEKLAEVDLNDWFD